MHMLVLTPLFPPDVSRPATYAKELVTRLSHVHEVTCLHYGQLPERAGDTTLISVRKDVATVIRLWHFALALWQQRHADVVILMNGPSVELPFLLLSLSLPAPLIYIENDHEAIGRTGWIGHTLHRLVQKRARHTITPDATLLNRPILHPLESNSSSALRQYQEHWTAHTGHIVSVCKS